MRTLSGRTVALLEGRKTSELALMVQRLGGVPVSAPAVRELPTLDGAGDLIQRIVSGQFAIAVILTGAGASALFGEAERQGNLPLLIEAMRVMTLACRGPKPQAVLKRHGLTPSIISAKPHTTNELVEALEAVEVVNRSVMLLHYGEVNEPLADVFRARGALVEDVCLYQWALPEDVSPLEDVIRRVINGSVDAVLFTSQVQFRFLEQIAERIDALPALIEALNTNVIVGAIGPVCASALRSAGVVPDVLPASANSASLVGAVADYFAFTTPEETPS